MRERALGIANVIVWVAIALGLWRGHVPADAFGWDLGVVRDASRLLLDGRPLYDYGEQARAHFEEFGRAFAVHYPYAYPPILAIELVPLARATQAFAFALMFTASVAALFFSARSVTGRTRDALWVTLSFPAILGLFAGQFVFLALGLFTATYALLRRERPFAAGLVASLLAYKPPLLLVLPVALFVLPRARRALVTLTAGVGAQIALCFAIAPAATRDYPRAAIEMARYTETHFRISLGFTWRSFFAALMPTHTSAVRVLAAAFVVVSAAIACVAIVRARADLEKTMAIVVIATLACAWHCMPYDWVLLALPTWLLLPRASPSPLGLRALVFAFASVWFFVPLVDAQLRAFGMAVHPAMPALALFSWWLVRQSRQLPAS